MFLCSFSGSSDHLFSERRDIFEGHQGQDVSLHEPCWKTPNNVCLECMWPVAMCPGTDTQRPQGVTNVDTWFWHHDGRFPRSPCARDHLCSHKIWQDALHVNTHASTLRSQTRRKEIHKRLGAGVYLHIQHGKLARGRANINHCTFKRKI